MIKHYKAPVLAMLAAVLVVACGKQTVETTPVRRDVTEAVFAAGVLEAEGTYNLTAQMEGYLHEVNFEEGDVVSAGKVLALIDNRENMLNTESAEALYEIARTNVSALGPALREAENSIRIAKEKLALDSLQMMRYKRLHAENSVAKLDYDNALLQYNTSKENYASAIENYRAVRQQSQQQLINDKTQQQISRVRQEQNKIKAVVAGKVYKKYKQAGDFVKKGDVIALIGDGSRLYARVNIDESTIGKIKLGQQALVQLNIDKEKEYRGKVADISPSFDEQSQSFICKIYFEQQPAFSILGTQLQSNIIVGVQKNALLIPRNYLDFGGYVNVKRKKERVKVETAFVSNEWVQVTKGIDDKTVLITEKTGTANGASPADELTNH